MLQAPGPRGSPQLPHGPLAGAVARDFSPPTAKLDKLLTELFALTFRAGGFLFARYDGFKLVVALPADVFKNWHIVSSFKMLTAASLL
jgi:hypothetical protein